MLALKPFPADDGAGCFNMRIGKRGFARGATRSVCSAQAVANGFVCSLAIAPRRKIPQGFSADERMAIVLTTGTGKIFVGAEKARAATACKLLVLKSRH